VDYGISLEHDLRKFFCRAFSHPAPLPRPHKPEKKVSTKFRVWARDIVGFMKIPRPYNFALAVAAATFLLGLLTGIGFFTTFGLIGFFAAGGMLFAKGVAAKGTPDVTSRPQVSLPLSADREVPSVPETWVRGVSNFQSDLRKVGKGPHTFLFIAEPTNKFDNYAVKVCVQSGQRQLKVGYLPAGSDATVSIHQLALHLAKSGQIISGPGVIENGDVGLVARVQTPDWSTVRDSLRSIQRAAAIARGEFRSITTSGPQPDLETEFFPKMELINQREFESNVHRFQTEPGKHVVWYLLNPVSDDEIGVHLSFPGEFPGPQVGRIAKRHLQWAKGYTHNGPICGRGFLKVGNNGSVAPELVDPDWK
jgi:hypothetical protein